MSGGTDWDKYQVPTLASITNEDLTRTWQQVGAWLSTADMIATTRRSMVGARADLAAAWPPETSEAAVIFYEMIDMIVGFMTDTENATRTNAAALGQTLDSMTATKDAVQQLHNTWQLYQRQMRDAATPSQAQTDEGLPYNWTASLNAEAQGHMVATDQVVFDTTRSLIVPAELPPMMTVEPLTPVSVGGTSGSNSGTMKRHSVAPPPTSTTISQGGQGLGAPPGLPGEPVLTGQGPVIGGGSASGTSGAGGGLGVGPGPVGPGWPNGGSGGPGQAPSPGGPGAFHPPSHGVPVLGDGTVPGSTVTLGGSSSVSHLLGVRGTAESPATSLGEFEGTRAGTPNVGGVIEPTEGVPPGGGMMVPSMMGGLRSHTPNGRKHRSALDTMWDLPVGVPSIIVAAIESDVHDPGRGVIGIDL